MFKSLQTPEIVALSGMDVVQPLFFLGIMTMLAGHIWLVLIVMRGSPFAALLCLVVPFLWLLFVRDHWLAAKPAVFTMIAGALLYLVGLIGVMSLQRPV